MKIVERNARRVTFFQHTRLAALLSLIMLVIFANLAMQLPDSTPPQQGWLLMGLVVVLAYLFYQSIGQTTITIDLTSQRLNWQHRKLFWSRQQSFNLSDIAEARVDARQRTHSRQPRTRSRAELIFMDSTGRPPFVLTPHHLPGTGAQTLAAEINAALAGSTSHAGARC